MQNSAEFESGVEKRRHLRLPTETKVFVEVESSGVGGEEPDIVMCTTLDVSRGGLRVQLSVGLIPNAILQIGVNLPNAEEETYFLTGEVMWCMATEEPPGEYLAGFRLINGSQTDISFWEEALLERDSKSE